MNIYNLTSAALNYATQAIQEQPLAAAATLVAVGALALLPKAARYCSTTYLQMQRELQNWCNEPLDDTPERVLERANRPIAASKIKEAFLNRAAHLDLSHLNLSSLPSCIGHLVKLKTLNLAANKLTSLPAEIGNLVNLRELQLWNNGLTSLPAEIGNLVNLTYLSLTANRLRSVPAQVGNLVNLTMLNLSHNELPSLPDQIGHLVKLRRLNLSNNQLPSVPAQIGHLVNLTTLNLFDNQLTSLPVSLAGLPRNCPIDADNNPLTAAAINTFQDALFAARAANPQVGPWIFHFTVDQPQTFPGVIAAAPVANLQVDPNIHFSISQMAAQSSVALGNAAPAA